MSDVTDNLMRHFADLAEKFAPNVIDAAKQATQVEALKCLILSLVELPAGCALLYAAYRLAKMTHEGLSDSFEDGLAILALIFCSLFGLIFTIGAVIDLVDPWTYVALAHPELWIAKKALCL